MVFETLGDNLLKLVKKYKYKGIPIPIVKNLTRQILTGLDYLHKYLKSHSFSEVWFHWFRGLSIIHTDLKLENVMLSVPLVSRPVVDVESIVKSQSSYAGGFTISSKSKLSKSKKRRMKAKLRKQAECLDSATTTVNTLIYILIRINNTLF